MTSNSIVSCGIRTRVFGTAPHLSSQRGLTLSFCPVLCTKYFASQCFNSILELFSEIYEKYLRILKMLSCRENISVHFMDANSFPIPVDSRLINGWLDIAQ